MPTEPGLDGLLDGWSEGDADAGAELIQLVYSDLREIARRCLRGDRMGARIRPTELVHEVYLRLASVRTRGWQDPSHFLNFAARLMRRLLVDLARATNAKKRGGGLWHSTLSSVTSLEGPALPTPEQMIDLDRALDRLGEENAILAQLVELRYFGGLTYEEISSALGMSTTTAKRAWLVARAWLVEELGPEPDRIESS